MHGCSGSVVVELYSLTGEGHGLAMALETLAWMAAEADQHERAACLPGSVERVRDEISLAVMELFRPQHAHITNILNKLGLNSRIQVSRWISELAEPAPVL